MAKPIHCIADARRYARRRMPKIMFDCVDGAAGAEYANGLNQEKIQQLRLLPRVLVNVAQRDLSTRFLDRDWGLPFGIAPMGMCNLTWPDADRMLADAAKKFDIPMALSTMSSTSLEQVAQWIPENGWFQLYVGQSESQAMQLVQRVEDAGYTTLILTVDVPQVAPRVRDLKNGFEAPLRIGVRQIVDFALHPGWSVKTLLAGAPSLANFSPGEFYRDGGRGLVDWEFLDRLRRRWKGRLIVKGVLSVEDALRIQNTGIDSIYVSNHGGRQLDAAPAAIDMLPLLREALGPDYPMLFDSGIRGGEGVVKALALGASFVMLGRSLLYGLGADGEHGLQRVIDLVRNEISVTMAQIGCTGIQQINHSVIVQK